jgi:hypothetical protein
MRDKKQIVMKKKNKLTPLQARYIVRAHNESEHGLNLSKVNKSLQTGYLDTPLFKQENQTKLF